MGARATLAAGLVLQAAGFGLLPLVSEAWHAYALRRIPRDALEPEELAPAQLGIGPPG